MLYDGSRPYVFIAVTDRSLTVARRRDIQIGLADETFIEVLHGLAERDAVVTTGNYELSNGMAIRTAAPVAKQQP